jgi:GNAT superfamily N-acetyltransferase
MKEPNPFEIAPHGGDFYVSFDKNLLDEAFVIREITTSYWGSWRSPIVILRSIERSICAGLYARVASAPEHEDFPARKDVQIGFARVVSDGCTIAYLCDVVVTKEYRGRGLGKFLVGQVLNNPELKERAWLLLTHDAQKFYAENFGFQAIQAMKKLPHPKAG